MSRNTPPTQIYIHPLHPNTLVNLDIFKGKKGIDGSSYIIKNPWWGGRGVCDI